MPAKAKQRMRAIVMPEAIDGGPLGTVYDRMRQTDHGTMVNARLTIR
jgi:hypothetical protein